MYLANCGLFWFCVVFLFKKGILLSSLFLMYSSGSKGFDWNLHCCLHLCG